MIALGQDDTVQQRIQHPPGREQIIKRGQRARLGRLRRGARGFKVRPRGRNEQRAAVGQHHDQLQPAPAAHPASQLERAAFPRVAGPDYSNRRREAIEVGLVSCLPSTESVIAT
ncbi:MAG TPA: hypothetical protein VGH56_09955 [Solirubrobacteraceae bacterium]